MVSFTPRLPGSWVKIPWYPLSRRLDGTRFGEEREREREKIYTYEGVYKLFRTSAATYTAVVVTRSTGRW
jgi:hypothetical protein